MRTTIDLPDHLFREVKSTAAARGLKLKEFIAESLRAALKRSEDASATTLTPAETQRHRMEKHTLAAEVPSDILAQQAALRRWFDSASLDRNQTGPVGPLNREELYARHGS